MVFSFLCALRFSAEIAAFLESKESKMELVSLKKE